MGKELLLTICGYHRAPQIPSPSLAGQTEIAYRAGLLAPATKAFRRLPMPSAQRQCRIAGCYSGGTAPDSNRLPFQVLRHPIQFGIEFWSWHQFMNKPYHDLFFVSRIFAGTACRSCNELLEFLRRHRTGEIIPLHKITSRVLQHRELVLRLHAFRNHGHFQVPGNIQD